MVRAGQVCACAASVDTMTPATEATMAATASRFRYCCTANLPENSTHRRPNGLAAPRSLTRRKRKSHPLRCEAGGPTQTLTNQFSESLASVDAGASFLPQTRELVLHLQLAALQFGDF